MIVYVETNFILELALEQKEALAAEDILKLAESNDILKQHEAKVSEQ